MSKIKCYVISCSSGSQVEVRNLYVWGGFHPANWLPTTKREAEKHIRKCQMETECIICDAEIQEIEVPRKKETLLQILNKFPEKVD